MKHSQSGSRTHRAFQTAGIEARSQLPRRSGRNPGLTTNQRLPPLMAFIIPPAVVVNLCVTSAGRSKTPATVIILDARRWISRQTVRHVTTDAGTLEFPGTSLRLASTYTEFCVNTTEARKCHDGAGNVMTVRTRAGLAGYPIVIDKPGKCF